jgi:pimeloyl-ACP methyl ester carboxylesterase/DNA-binding CsgD family transcriptional regulator
MSATMNPPQMQYAKTSDGVNIAYFSLGDGPPIVFASNILGDAYLYRLGWPHVWQITNRLAALGWRVIRYDLRGMGSSDRDVPDLSPTARVKDLQAVVERLGLTRFALVGCDYGAATSVAYSVQNQSRVSRLILLSPWASAPRCFSLPDFRVATSLTPAAGREWNVFTNVLGSVVTAFDSNLGRQGADAVWQGISPQNLATYYEMSKSIDLTGMLRKLATPTLVIHEPTFPFGSLELCQEVATSVKDARFVIVDDRSIAGNVHDGYVAAINDFLRSGAASGPPSERPRERDAALTTREVEVLRLIAGGRTNREIASNLVLSERTVARHITNIYAKIVARSKAEATAYAIRHGLT